MKKLLLLWLMIAPMSGMAQNESTPQDTTLYVNGRKIVIKEQGDKIKVKLYESASGGDTITNAQIFEGVYLNGQSTESRTVLSALPFSKKNNKRSRFEPQAGGSTSATPDVQTSSHSIRRTVPTSTQSFMGDRRQSVYRFARLCTYL